MSGVNFKFKPYNPNNFWSTFGLPTTAPAKSIFGNTSSGTSKNGIMSFFGKPSSSGVIQDSKSKFDISSIFKGDTKTLATTQFTWGKVFAYLLAIIIVLFAILIFVHFFITPVFKFKPGGSGLIRVPGFDDGKLFWKDDSTLIPNKNTTISDMNCNYSLIMDIFIENPLQFSTRPRVLFDRGGMKKAQPSNEDTLMSIYTNYNLVVALEPNVNDLIVSTLNTTNNMESIIIPNVPVQEPFRLGIVLMSKMMEVYINGELMKTHTFNIDLKDSVGDISGPSGPDTNVFKVRNLKIWPRPLTTGEIRESTPEMTSLKGFNAGVMSSSSSSCLLDRAKQLAVDSVPDNTL